MLKEYLELLDEILKEGIENGEFEQHRYSTWHVKWYLAQLMKRSLHG